MNKTTPFQNLLAVNTSKYDDNQYYAGIKPEVVSALAEAIKLGQVKLNKYGDVEIKGYKNQNKKTGDTFISLKWIRPEPEQAPVKSDATKSDFAKIDESFAEDIPF